MSKYLVAALLTTALFTCSASAQTASTKTAADSAASSHKEGEWRASKLVGVNVYNEANEKIGDINDVILDKSGKAEKVILGVGGFLGMGEHDVAVPFDKLKFVNEAVAYTGAAGNNPNSAANRSAATTTTGAATGTDNKPATTTTATSASKWYPDHAVFNASKDELKNMPEFKYSE